MKIFLEAGCFLWVVNLARSALLPSAEKELDLKRKKLFWEHMLDGYFLFFSFSITIYV